MAARCVVCQDERRDRALLCVVARVQDLLAIERSGAMRGKYFVLGRLLSPLDGISAEDLPLDRLTDAHRLLPGLGILKLKEMFAAFKRIGYDQVASVEIFRPEYWELDARLVARTARAKAAAVLANAGYVIDD